MEGRGKRVTEGSLTEGLKLKVYYLNLELDIEMGAAWRYAEPRS